MLVNLRIPMTLGGAALEAALEALCAINCAILSSCDDVPSLYESGVWYQREPRGREEWRNIIDVLRAARHGVGSDCEDLSAYRVSELRVREGEPARAIATKTGRHRYHAVVRRADGSIEDPSRILKPGG